MAINAIRVQTSYRGAFNFSPGLSNMEKIKSISSKVSQETTLLKALENKKFWDELLEKLRKSGGGGGNDSRFDRIAVSMMLSNFLTNKMILALMRNLRINPENILSSVIKTESKSSNHFFINFASSVHKIFVSPFGSIQTSLIRFTNTNTIQKTIKLFNEIAGILSFQLNRLKEATSKKIKSNLKKIKESTVTFIESIINEAIYYMEFLGRTIEQNLSMLLREIPSSFNQNRHPTDYTVKSH
jgi:hypothetical protein